ncbi:MAG: PD-(D/E)XK nuclease family protein [Treponema sp.]|nr:PD-(D/E)XK nuclease family protein [Treponema sp.]
MNLVESILLNNIANPNSLFIFPTEISSSMWADHLLRLMSKEKENISIAIEKFIAWDDFKSNSIKSKVQNKKSIPSALRKIFVDRLVRENGEKAALGTPVFISLILPEWAQQAAQFSSWLTVILPQLGSWFKKKTGLNADFLSDEAQKAALHFVNEDIDMYTIALRYAQFLKDHGLFEPAWETPPFNNEGKDCFLFFPDSLSDYSEYKELLTQSEHVKIIDVPEEFENNCDAFFYTNSRSEITEASLYIRALNEQGISWDSIAVCLADPENYEPYALREFSNRNIPYVKRISKALTNYPAGTLFRAILDCCGSDFSFSSLVSLVMNKSLTWKNASEIGKLIQFGMENNCLYSWIEVQDGKEEHINVWEDAFKKPVNYYDNKVRDFFMELKRRLRSFRNAGTFAELRKQYFIFRSQFFNIDEFSKETNNVLSRCIKELMELVELEKSFPDVQAFDPFLFFTDYLNEVFYLPKPETTGVAILPYKTAAAAPFNCHIILGAGHEKLSLIYSKLGFLSKKKREELGIRDEDASDAFINMHKYNSIKNSAFFCSEHTFSNYAIPHPKTRAPSKPRQRYAGENGMEGKFYNDYYDLENLKEIQPQYLHENQINGFTEWKNRHSYDSNELNDDFQDDNEKLRFFESEDEIKNIISDKYKKDGKIRVSASSLRDFFQCSLKWLFQNVFSLQSIQMETSMMAENISGSVYHAVINKFFVKLKEKGEALGKPVQGKTDLELPSSYKDILKESIDSVFNDFPVIDGEILKKISSLTTRLLQAGKEDFYYHLEKCLAYFLSFFAGCYVTGSESYYTIQKDSYLLNGYVDCILKEISDGTEKYIIVDFKRKSMPKRVDYSAQDDNPLKDFQLPMYITLAQEKDKIKVYTALFYSVLNLKPEVVIGTVSNIYDKKIIPKKQEDQILRDSVLYKKILDEFLNKAEQYAREISTGNLSVFPQDKNDCYNCNFNRICRTVYIIDCENNYLLGKD